MAELTVVGKPVTRVDANEKVTGQIVYGYDLALPNMLYGKTLFSPKAHARIKKHQYGKSQSSSPASLRSSLAKMRRGPTASRSKTSRFSLKAKSAISASRSRRWRPKTKTSPQAAVKLIEVEYEDLPVYTDPGRSLQAGRIAIHEDLPNYRKVNFIVPGTHANIAEHFKLRTGDVEQGFKESDLVSKKNISCR